MTDVAALAHALASIEVAAKQVVHDHANEERRAAFCAILREQRPIVASDHELGSHDSWRLNIVRGMDAILRAETTTRRISELERARLVASYVRMLRADIANLAPVLRPLAGDPP